MKVAGKRAQDRTCLGYAEREQVRRRQRAKMKEMSRIRSTGMGGSVLYTVKDGVISSVVEKSIIQQQFLTLLLLSCVCLVVVLYQLFGGQKVAKSPGTRKNQSARALLKNCFVKQYLSVAQALSLELAFCFTALRDLCGSAL